MRHWEESHSAVLIGPENRLDSSILPTKNLNNYLIIGQDDVYSTAKKLIVFSEPTLHLSPMLTTSIQISDYVKGGDSHARRVLSAVLHALLSALLMKIMSTALIQPSTSAEVFLTKAPLLTSSG